MLLMSRCLLVFSYGATVVQRHFSISGNFMEVRVLTVEMIVVVLYHNICCGVVISYEIVEMMLVEIL